MSDRAIAIKGLRDSIVGSRENEIDEGKRVKIKKIKGTKGKKARKVSKQYYKKHKASIALAGKKKRRTPSYKKTQAEIKRVGKTKKGTRRVTGRDTKTEEFQAWMEDVDEAVDQFIGMDMDVLPVVPWEKWFEEGMSAVVAAKSAVEMYEDNEEDNKGDDDDEDDVDEDDDDLEEVFGIGKLSYGKWVKKVDGSLKKAGKSFVKAKEKYKISNPVIHGWYMAGYNPGQVANWLVMGKKAVERAVAGSMSEERAVGTVRERLTASLGGWADTLGINLEEAEQFTEAACNKGKDKDEEKEESFFEPTGEEDQSEKNTDQHVDGLFGVDIGELAGRAKGMIKATMKKVETRGLVEDEDYDGDEGDVEKDEKDTKNDENDNS